MTEKEKQELGLPLRIDPEWNNVILDRQGKEIGCFECRPTAEHKDKARAAYAVRAVNAHAALVEACEAAFDDINFMKHPTTMAKLAHALALARGEGK